MTASIHIGEYKLPFLRYQANVATGDLVLFIHGLGEVGPSSGAYLNRVLGPSSFAKHASQGYEYPFDIVAPQLAFWNHKDVKSLISHLAAKYSYKRIFITGLSGGGEVTWKMLSEDFTDIELKGIAPVSGHWKAGISIACSLRDKPVYSYHNRGDRTIPLASEQSLIDALKNCAGRTSSIEQFIYETSTHDAWTEAYKKGGSLEKIVLGIFSDAVPVKDPIADNYFDGEYVIFTTQTGKTLKIKPV
jgi:predicted peptidase